jgi:hypothetical protein
MSARGVPRQIGPVAFGACAAGLVAAAVALAAPVTVNDANDTNGKIDIQSASATRTSSGKLKHVVKFFDAVPAKGEVGNEFLEMWKKKPHQLQGAPGAFQEAPYKIMGPQTGKRPVFTGGEAGTPLHKTGTATVTRKGKTLTFVFSPAAIGNPSGSYYWKVRSDFYGPESVCPGGPCEDLAPNGGKVVKQSLKP